MCDYTGTMQGIRFYAGCCVAPGNIKGSGGKTHRRNMEKRNNDYETIFILQFIVFLLRQVLGYTGLMPMTDFSLEMFMGFNPS